MTAVIIALHVIACVLLITIILVQRGRGGGLLETFSGVESLFGTKTSAFLSRSTSVLAVIFFITCLSLAFLAARQSRSILRGTKPVTPEQQGNIVVTEPEQSTQELPQAPQPGEVVPKEIPQPDVPKVE